MTINQSRADALTDDERATIEAAAHVLWASDLAPKLLALLAASPVEQPAAPMPRYTEAMGTAAQAYLERVVGHDPKLPIFWADLWSAMRDAAEANVAPSPSASEAEVVAWVRKHPDTGALSGDWLWNDNIEQCRKDSGVWFPLGFVHAAPPAQEDHECTYENGDGICRECAELAKEKREKNRPILELMEQYRKDGFNFDDIEGVKRCAMRYVQTMPDSQVRTLLYTLAIQPDTPNSELKAHVKWIHGVLREKGYCIDGGKCHHGCSENGECWRQNGCGPLSGSRLTDNWTLPESNDKDPWDRGEVCAVCAGKPGEWTCPKTTNSQYHPRPEAACRVLSERITDFEKKLDDLIYAAWYSGEQDGVDSVKWNDKGDSYNQVLRSRIAEKKSELLKVLK